MGTLTVGLRGAVRYALYDHKVAPLHPADPCYYLFILGVDPTLQGRGIGSALLRAFCNRADSAGMAGYLETDKETSVRLYEQHGFKVTHDLQIASLGGLRMWTMLRARV